MTARAPFPSSPPTGRTPRPWSFPPTERRTLPSGLELVAVRMPALPIVHLRLAFRAGRSVEPLQLSGASRLLMALLRHGTRTHDSDALARTLDHVGARLRISIAPDSSVIGISVLQEHLHQALDLLTDVALHPSLPPDHLEKERKKHLEIHHHQASQPESVGGQWLAYVLYGAHPYGVPSLTRRGLEATTRDHLLSLHAAIVRPDHGQLVVTGDIDPHDTLSWLEAHFASWSSPPTPLHTAGEPGPEGPPRIVVVDRPGSEQTQIQVGHRLFDRAHPDYMPVRVLNQVLGGGASSRLFHELRERQSLTYGAYSSLDCGLVAGDLSAQLSCAPDKAAQAVAGLLHELRRVHDEPIPEAEVDLARQYLIGSFPQKAAGIEGVAGLVTTAWSHRLGEQVWDHYQEAVAHTSTDDVARAAQRWVRPQEAHWVLVGPADACRDAVAHLGRVEVVALTDDTPERVDRDAASDNP